MAESLGDRFPKEMARVLEVLGYYKESGPAAAWATTEIKRDLDAAQAAWDGQDTVAMIRIYPRLCSIK